MTDGPITKNGIHPITHQAAKVHPKGEHGSAKEAPPKEAQKPAAGAKETGAGGKHMHEGDTIAAKFYPPVGRPGLKGRVEQ